MSMNADIEGSTGPMPQQWASMHAKLCRFVRLHCCCSLNKVFWENREELITVVSYLFVGYQQFKCVTKRRKGETKEGGGNEAGNREAHATATNSFSILHRRVLAVTSQYESNDNVSPVLG
jgi:hypothetical protein